MVPGQPVRRELEYIRHGTLCWMGALDVRRGKPFGFTCSGHDSDTFIELLDMIDAVYPPGLGHVIMDNLSARDTPDVNEWFDEHPRWSRHFTPKHASWLNQIECWFSILGRQALARGSFTSTSGDRRSDVRALECPSSHRRTRCARSPASRSRRAIHRRASP